MNIYAVSAMGLAGEILRPARLPVQDQAAAVLPYIGGYQTSLVENIRLDGMVFVKSARSSVGSSYDDLHDSHTGFASVVIEDINLCDMVTADRVVARISAARSGKESESRFSLTGTRFENLKIAGHLVDVHLKIDPFHQVSTFSSLAKIYSEGKLKDFVPGSNLPPHLEDRYHPLVALSELRRREKETKALPSLYSLANQVQVEGASELQAFGSIIVVPDFGVIHLAELFVTQYQRRLTMLRLEIGSPIEGKLVAATCAVGDTTDSTGPR